MDTFSAIADPNRRRIIEMIASSGELTSTDIANKFKISAPAISQHLKILREARLVDMEKRAQQRIYTINKASLKEIEEWTKKLKKVWEDRFSRLDKVLIDLDKKGGK